MELFKSVEFDATADAYQLLVESANATRLGIELGQLLWAARNLRSQKAEAANALLSAHSIEAVVLDNMPICFVKLGEGVQLLVDFDGSGARLAVELDGSNSRKLLLTLGLEHLLVLEVGNPEADGFWTHSSVAVVRNPYIVRR